MENRAKTEEKGKKVARSKIPIRKTANASSAVVEGTEVLVHTELIPDKEHFDVGILGTSTSYKAFKDAVAVGFGHVSETDISQVQSQSLTESVTTGESSTLIGPSGSTPGIFVDTPSFEQFKQQVENYPEENGLESVTQKLNVLDLIRGEKFCPNESEASKNETRQWKRRRIRQSGCHHALCEEKMAGVEESSNSVYSTAETPSKSSLPNLVEPLSAPPVSTAELLRLKKEAHTPLLFDLKELDSNTGRLPDIDFPANLKRLGDISVEELFNPEKDRLADFPVLLSPTIQMVPSFEGFIGRFHIQNKTSNTLTYRVRASAKDRYEFKSCIGQLESGDLGMSLVRTLPGLELEMEDIIKDSFVVDIIPLTKPFPNNRSLLLFWKCQDEANLECRVPVKVETPICPPLMLISPLQKPKLQTPAMEVLATIRLSDEMFQLRSLESGIENSVFGGSKMKDEEKEVNPPSIRYGFIALKITSVCFLLILTYTIL